MFVPRRALKRQSLIAALLVIALYAASAQTPIGEGWPTYGGDPGGTRFSRSSQINRTNLNKLQNVWTFHTHATDSEAARKQLPSFETTPVLSGDTLFFTSPLDEVFAIDARTGTERWQYGIKLHKLAGGSIVTSRGVALWPLDTPQTSSVPCDQRVFLGTLDAHLIALDAHTGQPCIGFGNNGIVDLTIDIHFQNLDSYSVTSPPTVIGNVVVIGSTVSDNQQVDVESGAVRAYDVITGKRRWLWEPLLWAEKQKIRTGAGNVWSIVSADPALGLVYLPTGSASPDFYGGNRPGDNRDANSIVALDAATGKKIWSFQVVHHDVWDYDIASQPILFTWRGSTPAIAITTKMGMIFLLDRRTGQPLVPIEERPVPPSHVPGEQLSPTQPFQNIPTLAPLEFGQLSKSSYHRSPADEALCNAQIETLHYEGIYTPPSLEGSLYYPGNLGGVNWGGAAIDPVTGILYANTNRQAFSTKLLPRYGREMMGIRMEHFILAPIVWGSLILIVFLLDTSIHRRFKPGWPTLIVVLATAGTFGGSYIHDLMDPPPARVLTLDHFGNELSPQRKSPYLIKRSALVDSQVNPCTPAPWGAITAVNLNTLTKVWEKPLGTAVEGSATGILNFGGPIVTSSGLVFTAAAEDPYLRVFDAATGDELKKLALPLPGQATPMTYTLDGTQYVVIAAGGHGDGHTALGDSLVAFAIR